MYAIHVQHSQQETMRRDPNTSKLMAIEPQSLAEDVHWFLDGLDSPHAPYDLDPFSNPKTCHLFDNADTSERRDSIDSSRSERAVEGIDYLSLNL